MIIYLEKRQTSPIHRILSAFIAFTFTFSLVMPPSAFSASVEQETILNLPVPGSMVPLSAGFTPAIVRGLTIHPENPLMFDFVIDSGDDNLQGNVLRREADKMIKYFLAALTIPEKELWVNLSPNERDRITSESLGSTEMGMDMLAQDYLLKQITASLMYPEDELGSKFWQRVHKKAKEVYGTTEIPMDTFNKVWIIPDKAVVYEHENTVFIGERHLKVMLEQDYLSEGNGLRSTGNEKPDTNHQPQDTVQNIIKEIIIPELEKEVNEGRNFANLRQMFNSMILAAWYKQNLQQSLLGQVYMDQGKTRGIDTENPKTKERIYDQYLTAFKKGVYNYIKEDFDEETKKIIPRKYFSGGLEVMPKNLETRQLSNQSYAVQQKISSPVSKNGSHQNVTWAPVEISPNTSSPAIQDTIAQAQKKLIEQNDLSSKQKLVNEAIKVYSLSERSRPYLLAYTNEKLPPDQMKIILNVLHRDEEDRAIPGDAIIAFIKNGGIKATDITSSSIDALASTVGVKHDSDVESNVRHTPLRNESPEGEPLTVSKGRVATLPGAAILDFSEGSEKLFKLVASEVVQFFQQADPVTGFFVISILGAGTMVAGSKSWEYFLDETIWGNKRKLKSPVASVRFAAVKKLGTFTHFSTAVAALFEVLDDEEAIVRDAAFQILNENKKNLDQSQINILRAQIVDEKKSVSNEDAENRRFWIKKGNELLAQADEMEQDLDNFRPHLASHTQELVESLRAQAKEVFDIAETFSRNEIALDTEQSSSPVGYKFLSKNKTKKVLDILATLARTGSHINKAKQIRIAFFEDGHTLKSKGNQNTHTFTLQIDQQSVRIDLPMAETFSENWTSLRSMAELLVNEHFKAAASSQVVDSQVIYAAALETLKILFTPITQDKPQHVQLMVKSSFFLEWSLMDSNEFGNQFGLMRSTIAKGLEKKGEGQNGFAEFADRYPLSKLWLEAAAAFLSESSEESQKFLNKKHFELNEAKAVVQAVDKFAIKKIFKDLRIAAESDDKNLIELQESYDEQRYIFKKHKCSIKFFRYDADTVLFSFLRLPFYYDNGSLNEDFTLSNILKKAEEDVLAKFTASSPVNARNEQRATGDDSLARYQTPDTSNQNVGGIDLNPDLLDLQIKRDGNGIPLPLPQQPIQDMNIQGFFPVIINIAPISVPMFLGMDVDEKTDERQQRTADNSMDLSLIDKYQHKLWMKEREEV
ncbi:MAG: hypothetical protein KAJ18_06045 [Candidatus Omnitrophica bacterium]|nr:hypothetical protein [Candidatus Omnitrophota bacterium]